MVALALLGTGHYLSPGGRGSGGFGTKQGEILSIPPINVTSLKLSPLITFVYFRHPPPPPATQVFIFQVHFILVVPLLMNPSKVFSLPPFWVLSYD